MRKFVQPICQEIDEELFPSWLVVCGLCGWLVVCGLCGWLWCDYSVTSHNGFHGVVDTFAGVQFSGDFFQGFVTHFRDFDIQLFQPFFCVCLALFFFACSGCAGASSDEGFNFYQASIFKFNVRDYRSNGAILHVVQVGFCRLLDVFRVHKLAKDNTVVVVFDCVEGVLEAFYASFQQCSVFPGGRKSFDVNVPHAVVFCQGCSLNFRASCRLRSLVLIGFLHKFFLNFRAERSDRVPHWSGAFFRTDCGQNSRAKDVTNGVGRRGPFGAAFDCEFLPLRAFALRAVGVASKNGGRARDPNAQHESSNLKNCQQKHSTDCVGASPASFYVFPRSATRRENSTNQVVAQKNND